MYSKETLAEMASAYRSGRSKSRHDATEKYIADFIMPKLRKRAAKGHNIKRFPRIFFRNRDYADVKYILSANRFVVKRNAVSVEIAW